MHPLLAGTLGIAIGLVILALVGLVFGPGLERRKRRANAPHVALILELDAAARTAGNARRRRELGL